MHGQHRGILESAAAGALGGGLATVAMSAVMFAAKAAGLMGDMPPEKITAKALDKAGLDRHPAVQHALASAFHVAFGAGAGVMYAVVDDRLRPPGPGAVKGAAYGTAIWSVSYLGWVPMLGIMPPADRDRRGRAKAMLAAHWVFGLALVGVLRGLNRA